MVNTESVSAEKGVLPSQMGDNEDCAGQLQDAAIPDGRYRRSTYDYTKQHLLQSSGSPPGMVERGSTERYDQHSSRKPRS